LAYEEAYELLGAVAPTVETLMEEHVDRRSHWYAHEVVPWEQGRNYITEPWDPSDATVSPEVQTSLMLNLLTEDNLPSYHHEIASHFAPDSVYGRWTHRWTAEEGQHSIALRSYLLVSRNCNPRLLEDERMETMMRGYSTPYSNPIEVFAYTSAQELATRVSHRNAGKLSDDATAFDVMKRIAIDENHHFVFYKGIVAAMLKEDPSLVLKPIFNVLSSFEMPGVGIPGFVRKAVDIAKAGIYNLRIHSDRVVTPVLRDWGIEKLTGLSSEAAELQEKIMEIPNRLIRKAEIFERRMGISAV
jgi:acyl-[acyl-carrier-protein] desaturase